MSRQWRQPQRSKRDPALLTLSHALATHKTIGELFAVLAEQLHSVGPSDYLTLVQHDRDARRRQRPPGIFRALAGLSQDFGDNGRYRRSIAFVFSRLDPETMSVG
jgi:hypothetical protein